MVTVQIVVPRVRLAGDPILGELEHRIIALLCAGGKQAKVVRGGVSEIRYVGDFLAARRAKVSFTREKLDT